MKKISRRIKKVLVANRGEIALRVIRTCQEMGIQTVAVFSDVDRTSRHVREADEAYLLGPAPPLASYLSIEKILEVARRSKCDAIHPGYGFLAENSKFARKVESSGLIFIGPTSRSISAVGDKLQARAIMKRAGVPVIPGSDGLVTRITQARSVATKIGFPVLIKAVGGGGGKGMRIVEKDADLAAAMASARAEAAGAFGDPRIYVEKHLSHPRHIEVQILADHYGNLVHLGERECSIQRRFQKIIEESPSSFVDEELREKITQAALRAAKSCGYVNAGTVEFLMDENKQFYFLEVNARIQVEHPITEMRTGLDLVREQILIAGGGRLMWKQGGIQPRGHAIESRIYAEDPENEFLPSAGKILYLRPSDGNGVRIDSALEEGTEITFYYDPLISKVISWGLDREQARARMHRALKQYLIAGVKTTIPFCLFVIDHQSFKEGEYDTNFVPKYFRRDLEQTDRKDLELAVLISSTLLATRTEIAFAPEIQLVDGGNGWRGWKARRLENLTDSTRQV